MSEYESLVTSAKRFGSKYATSRSMWQGSPFEWILGLPSRTIGSVGEKLVQEIFRGHGADVGRAVAGTDHDRVINGHRIEIKFSTLWSEKSEYVFQQIRDQDYDYCVCLGISPNSAHMWVVPKSVLMAPQKGLGSQHGGSEGVDTKWFSVDPTKPLPWLGDYGGELGTGIKVLLDAGKGTWPSKSLSASDLP